MADWCYNHLAISGESERVAEVVAQMSGHYSDGSECLFAFDKILPPPDNLAQGATWYFDNWGCERYPIDCHVDLSASADYAVEFQSAYGPAWRVVAALAAQNPDLRVEHTYDFDAFGYGGSLIYEGGELIFDEFWNDEDDGDDQPFVAPGPRSRPSALAEDATGRSDQGRDATSH